MAKTTRTFTAVLTSPAGETDEYRVSAYNKTDARREIARIYRQDTPSARYGFYSFGQHALRWVDDSEA